MHSAESNSAPGQYVQQVENRHAKIFSRISASDIPGPSLGCAPCDAITVARKFVALYYRVLNNYASYLFQFYGSDSTVVVCQVKEDGQPLTTKAENVATVQELLRSLYEEVTITVSNCTPQPSSGGCISLLISGRMSVKPHSGDRAFTQALILSRQSDGYYIKTDTVLMFPKADKGSRHCSLLTQPARNAEIIAESTVAIAAQDPTNGKFRHELPRAICEEETQAAHHVRVSTIDTGSGTPSITSNRDKTQPTISFVDGTMEKKDVSYDIAFGMRYPAAPDGQQISSIDLTTRNIKGCIPAKDRPRMVQLPSGFMNHPNPFSRRCTSPLSAPGCLASPLTGERLVPYLDEYPQQPRSIRSSPRRLITDTQTASSEQFRVFACKLPLGITVEKVTEVFSQYGALAEDEPIRVFTGQNNCYACVCYTTARDMQKAIDAEIRIEEHVVVTDEWRPRPRRPRRGRQDAAPEQRPIGATN